MKNSRNGTAGAHGHARIAPVEDCFFSRGNIGGNSIVWDFEFFDGSIIHIGVDEIFQFIAFDKTAAPDLPIIINDIVLIHLKSDCLKIKSRFTRSVKTTDQRAGACSHNHVYGNFLRFQHLEHANVRKSLGSSASQHNRDFGRSDWNRRGCGSAGAQHNN